MAKIILILLLTISFSSAAELIGCGGQIGSKHIYGEGFVSKKATVSSDAFVGEDAEVCDRAFVGPGVVINDRAKVFGRARVYRNTVISNTAKVYGRARIDTPSRVDILDNSEIFGNARVSGNSLLFENAKVKGEALVKGSAILCGSSITQDDEIVIDSSKCQNTDLPELQELPGELFEVTEPIAGEIVREDTVDISGVYRSEKINSMVLNGTFFATLSSSSEFLFNDIPVINGNNYFEIQAFDTEGRKSDIKEITIVKE